MAQEKSNTIYKTKDYNIFKTLHGNRGISDTRVKKIISSINAVGYVSSPLLCNEKLEIIDGQGRFTALKKLGLPVEFYVVPGLTIRECISLNINQENWKVIDFIESYATQGNQNYKYLLELTKRYPGMPIRVLTYAIDGVIQNEKVIREGGIKCTAADYDRAAKALDYISSFNDLLHNAPNMTGVLTWYYIVLLFTFNLPGIDNDEMYKRVQKNINLVTAAGNPSAAAKVLEAIYNKGKRSDRVYIENEYIRYANRTRFVKGAK